MKKLAFTGMDALGSAMAIRLLHAGYQVTVYDKKKYSAEGPIAEGAIWADTVEECLKDAEYIF